jgi:hypothetical protein
MKFAKTTVLDGIDRVSSRALTISFVPLRVIVPKVSALHSVRGRQMKTRMMKFPASSGAPNGGTNVDVRQSCAAQVTYQA